MNRAALIEAIADKIQEKNGSDYSWDELKKHQPEAAKWARELAVAALDEIAAHDLKIVALDIVI